MISIPISGKGKHCKMVDKRAQNISSNFTACSIAVTNGHGARVEVRNVLAMYTVFAQKIIDRTKCSTVKMFDLCRVFFWKFDLFFAVDNLYEYGNRTKMKLIRATVQLSILTERPSFFYFLKISSLLTSISTITCPNLFAFGQIVLSFFLVHCPQEAGKGYIIH